MMTDPTIDDTGRGVRLRWADGTEGEFPFIWLRDNAPSVFHPETRERVFDPLAIPDDIAPLDVALADGALVIRWPGIAAEASAFDLAWLRAHRPGGRAPDPADIPPRLWRAELTATGIPRAVASELMADDAALLAWLRATRATGVSIVEGLDADREAGMAVARRVGFLRETNFGTSFEVMSKPNPNNLAYTAHALPMHTDLPNLELPPGIQFLHCIANEAEGGGTLLSDGFALAEDLRTTDRAAFDLLAAWSIPFRFHDADCDIRRRQRVIRLAEDGSVEEICFSNHLADVFDLPLDVLEPYYRAYLRFMAMARDPAYVVALKLKGGEMAVFDNRRVLHGREAFDPATGLRHLRGGYVDRGEFDSRLRVLAR